MAGADGTIGLAGVDRVVELAAVVAVGAGDKLLACKSC